MITAVCFIFFLHLIPNYFFGWGWLHSGRA